MSTEAMLNSHARLTEAAEFAQWLSDQGQRVTHQQAADLAAGAANPIYGPVVGSNLEHLRTSEAVA